MQITLVGMGPGDPAYRTRAAEAAIGRADCLIGAKRILDTVTADTPAFAMTRPEEIAAFLRRCPYESVCVLLTGDTGLYSGAKKLHALLPEHTITTLPGISSVQLFAAALHRPWQDWHIVSGHGVACDALCEVLNHENACFLTDATTTPQRICETLVEAGLAEVQVTVGENLSYPSQRIVQGTAQVLSGQPFAPLSLVLCEREPAWKELPSVQGLSDDAFIRGDAPMTKSEVRAVSLAKLALREDDIVYDIGAGTGSVAVEAALRARRGKVYAVECCPESCALIRQNAARFHAHHLRVVEGMAPEALHGLPAPDAVFVGGSKGALLDILECVLKKNPAVRIVVNAVTLETLSALQDCARRLPLADVQWVQLSVSKARALGRVHLLAAQNPVFIFSARGGGA
ncbi:precorrin-6y C5,15-methyltransferase (decarboxylating) subunit CbiE [Eubacteriales bacterium OttesenSCG-928-A19]|nr:precorrin-6y C5,15-methyltransferase (decarboxylating) subunit CbiE [Eubacteriales bacterium OttesenSCG-928-A19]